MLAFYPTLAREFWQDHPAEILWKIQRSPHRDHSTGINPVVRSRNFNSFHENVCNLATDTQAIVIPNKINKRYSYDNDTDRILYQPLPKPI